MDYPLTQRGFEWANSVLDGEVPSCSYVRLACQRFAKDLERDDWDWVFDPEESERWLGFLARLRHVKGRWAGQLFDPAGYQCFITLNLYGWLHKETRLRRFLEGYVEVPRKNGKSFWFAGLGLGHLCIDNEPGAEVYCGATSEAQAWEVFRPARLMADRDPELQSEFDLQVNAKSLTRPSDGSRFVPLIGKPGDGPSPSCSIHDELHEHKTWDQVDAMETGMAARQQPMRLSITTAGVDFGGPCREKRADVIRILEGQVDDDRVFGAIFTIDEGDRWDSVESLKKANPNYGVSATPEYLAAMLNGARRSATKQNAFKTKHLNVWVGAHNAWMNMLAFQACKKRDLSIDDFEGERCFLGIDLATRKDIASVAALFPKGGKVAGFFRHYLPEDAIYQDARSSRYKGWAESGLIQVTPGNIIDFDYIEEDLKALASQFEIVEAAYDPFQATQFSTRMAGEGFNMVEVRPTVLNFSEPMKELEAKILAKDFVFDGDPVFSWMMGNVVARLDKKDNIYPNRESEDSKIDGVVAAIMAMKRIMDHKDSASVYETRGIRAL